MPDPSTTATVLGATSIVCGTVLAPLINAQIAKDRHSRESLLELLDDACNVLTTVGRTWPQANLAIESVGAETMVTPRLHDAIYVALDAFTQSVWDARAIQVRLRIRLKEHHTFYLTYAAAIHGVEPMERYVDAFRAEGSEHERFELLGADADDAWTDFNVTRLPEVFRRATHLYEDN